VINNDPDQLHNQCHSIELAGLANNAFDVEQRAHKSQFSSLTSNFRRVAERDDGNI